MTARSGTSPSTRLLVPLLPKILGFVDFFASIFGAGRYSTSVTGEKRVPSLAENSRFQGGFDREGRSYNVPRVGRLRKIKLTGVREQKEGVRARSGQWSLQSAPTMRVLARVPATDGEGDGPGTSREPSSPSPSPPIFSCTTTSRVGSRPGRREIGRTRPN